jgi:hypothetical protein
MNYLNAKNTFQWNNFTTCIAVPSLSPRQHYQQTKVTATYNTQSFTGISSMEALPHIKSASTGASRDSHSVQDSKERVGEKNLYLMGSHIGAESSLPWQLCSVLPGVLPAVCDQTI